MRLPWACRRDVLTNGDTVRIVSTRLAVRSRPTGSRPGKAGCFKLRLMMASVSNGRNR